MNIFLEDSNKPKILFLHGFGSNKKFINSILKLKRDFAIVSIDLHYKGKNSLLKMVKNVEETIEQNNWNKLVVVGHSMGGGVATMLANMDQVKKIILIAPLNPFLKQQKNLGSILLPKNKTEALRSLKLIVFDQSSWTNIAPLDFLTKNSIHYTQIHQVDLQPLIESEFMDNKFLENQISPFYNDFASKFSIIIGKQDQLVFPGSVEYIAKTWNIKLFQIEQCGHLPLFEKPQETVEIINQII